MKRGGWTGEQRYVFDGFRLDPRTRRLTTADGRPVALAARGFDTLLCLVRGRKRVLARDELLAQVWPGRMVEDNNLEQAVAAVRRALGDRADRPRYVLTVPRRGYRFVAEVGEEKR